MAFLKLDLGILNSSLWVEDPETRVVFITMLAMVDATGLCAATAPGIARRANLPLDRVRAALALLEAPDLDSRTIDHEGRRIQRVDGGYLMLNYLKYQKKDHTSAARSKRYRERHRATVTRDERVATRSVTHVDVDVDVVKEMPADAGGSLFEAWWTLYRKTTGRGTEKRETRKAFDRLSNAERLALYDRTVEWFEARRLLQAAGVFVAEAPDPKRYLAKKRWLDELNVPESDPKATPSPDDLEALRLARDDEPEVMP